MAMDEHEKIDELLKLEQENNRMLRKIRRSMAWSHAFSFLYWLAILGSLGASYYYFQPYVEKYWNTYQSVMKTLESVQQTGKTLPSNLEGMLDKVR